MILTSTLPTTYNQSHHPGCSSPCRFWPFWFHNVLSGDFFPSRMNCTPLAFSNCINIPPLQPAFASNNCICKYHPAGPWLAAGGYSSSFFSFSSRTEPHLGQTLVAGSIIMGLPSHPHPRHLNFAILNHLLSSFFFSSSASRPRISLSMGLSRFLYSILKRFILFMPTLSLHSEKALVGVLINPLLKPFKAYLAIPYIPYQLQDFLGFLYCEISSIGLHENLSCLPCSPQVA